MTTLQNMTQGLTAAAHKTAAWPRWRAVVEIAAALLLGIALGELFWAVVSPVRAPIGAPGAVAAARPQDRLSALRLQDPFGAAGAAGAALGAVSGVAGGSSGVTSVQIASAPATNLDLSLFGVSADRDGAGRAIMGASQADQTSYRVGDAVLPGVVLAKILPDRVLLERAGALESLYVRKMTETARRFLASRSIDEAMTVAAASPAPAPAARPDAAAPAVMDEPTVRAAGASEAVIPRMTTWSDVMKRIAGAIAPAPDGRGLMLRDRGDAGAALAEFGLAPGDILVSVDGFPVDLDSLRTLETRIDPADGVVAVILRDGRRLSLDFPPAP